MTDGDPAADPALVEEIHDWIASIDIKPSARAMAVPKAVPTDVMLSVSGITRTLDAQTPIVSNAVLGGELGADILQRSRQLKALIEQGDLAAGLAYFKDSPADGCTSLIDLARIKSGYDPLRGGAADNLRKFELFASTIVASPVFVRRVLDRTPVSWQTGNWNVSIRRVLNLFPKVRSEDLARIRKSVEHLTRAAASSPGRTQSGNLFVQNVLYSDTNDYQVYLYYAFASFKEIHEKKSDAKFETTVTVARAQLSFVLAAWPAYAEAVWDKHVCAVVDWLERNTTKAGNPAVTLCFDT